MTLAVRSASRQARSSISIDASIGPLITIVVVVPRRVPGSAGIVADDGSAAERPPDVLMLPVHAAGDVVVLLRLLPVSPR